MKHRRQRGVALLVAIVLFALATTMAAAITYNKAMAARRAAATFTMEQALQAGMAAEALASIALEAGADSQRTTLDQDWAQPLGPIEIEGTGVWIAAQVEDASSRFNLNSVVTQDPNGSGAYIANPDQVAVFRTLLHDLDIEDKYADLLVDWIDTDIAPEGSQGGEDTLYLTQVPPYRPPNTFITQTSELLALPGFGAENYKKIAPYVTALPLEAKINVCTASGLILDVAKNDTSNQEWAGSTTLAEDRKKGCAPLRDTWLQGISADQKQKAGERVLETSSWFRLRTNVRIGTAEFVLYSVLFREQNKKVRVVQRSFGSE
ncbi:MAG TPA: type II secretion system minor pseudopilin GspK [Steroidobacteraceae bacterium]|nr:type II secretion system minor pseudopilin GspK [Steroidobacteraceae bacterium]